ncbi:Uncharacterised protein [uncultured archaeon]|nr:Uncharacterised protein [uncultured archaeon]
MEVAAIHRSLFKLTGLTIALLLIIPFAASGQSGQLFLNVYVDDSSARKALVVGNMDDPSGLAFLNSSEHIYEENGQLYAATDSLLKEDDLGWKLDFPVSGHYDEYHAVFYIPGGYELRQINCSQGLEVLSSSYNGTLVLDVQGFDLIDPAVSLSYRAA